MNKKFKRIAEIESEIREMADTIQREKRSRNEEETKRYAALIREKEYLTMQLHASELHSLGKSDRPELRTVLRQMSEDIGRKFEIILRAEGDASVPAASTSHKTSDVKDGGMVPLTVGDIVKPLYEGLILSKIGIQLPTGLTGDFEWPVAEAVKATIAGEAVKADPTKINLSKVTVVKDRIAVGAEYTYESFFASAGKIDGLIKESLPMAVADTINGVMFSTTKANAAARIAGPLVGKDATTLGADSTGYFKGLLNAKAKVLGKGYSSAGMAYVMTEATKALLEATPRDKGSGLMIVENDRINGIPVFCTHYIGDNNIAIGNWKYQVCGLFGQPRLIVDPYSGADSNMIRIWLNVNYGTATLRTDAFELVKLGN